MRKLARSLALTAVSFAAACVNQMPLDHLEDDAHPELTVSADALATDFHREGGLLVSPPLTFEEGANRVALMATLADDSALPSIFVRGRDGDTHGPWRDGAWTFHEEDRVAGKGALDDVFLAVEIGIPAEAAPRFAEITFSPAFADDEELDALDAAAPAQSEDALKPELAYVGVLPRSAWGARAHRCSTKDYSNSRMALHHTAAKSTANTELALRQAQAYHMDGRGYCDVGYHFAVAQDGRIFELRPQPYRGGHTLNNNTGNVGVVFVGCFDPVCGNDVPTEALKDAGAGIIAMEHLVEGIAINADKIRGHRDHAGAQTACPGANLYPLLGDIRARAQAKIDALNAGSSAPPPATSTPAPAGCGAAGSNTVIAKGSAVTSCDGRFTFAHQTDGNVVLYQNGVALWHTGTNGQSTSQLVMQGDGNLVLYATSGSALWHTGTFNHPGASLAVQNDGNVVVYSSGGTALWSTGTCCR